MFRHAHASYMFRHARRDTIDRYWENPVWCCPLRWRATVCRRSTLLHPSTHPPIPVTNIRRYTSMEGIVAWSVPFDPLQKKNLMSRRSQAERWLGGANRCCWHHTMLAGPTQLESRPGPWLQKRMPMLHSPTQKMTLYLKIQAARTFLRHGRAPIELKMGLCAVPKA